ncbi:MAG TPA: hypothetical protein VGX28_03545 [Frankiaceae bacterium]|jgi:hypothetical protein|nr:hypothetical protein [Frankiaceae bacterium]
MRERAVGAAVAGLLTAGLVTLAARLDAAPPLAVHGMEPSFSLGEKVRHEHVLVRRPCGIDAILGATPDNAEGWARPFGPRLDLTLYAVPHAGDRVAAAERALTGCTDPGYPGTVGRVRRVGGYVVYTGGDAPDAEALAGDVERALREKGLA